MRSTVLIADDQADVRSALSMLIEAESTLELVGAAADADEAIRLAEEHLPDAALIDVMMPGGGGPRAVREIAVRSPSTRMVALSAYGDRATVFQMLRSGAVGYLVKGAGGQEIVRAIHSALHGESVLSPAVAADVLRTFAGQLERDEAETESHKLMLDRVRRVLDERQLSTVFQPIIELSTREVAGYEALARIGDEPRRSPHRWFAEAAMVGLGLELEVASLRSALAALEKLPRRVFLTVNVDPQELMADAVLEILAHAPAERLIVEVTEHAPVQDYDALASALADFRGRGGRLAVDDAGAGFASLRHVLKLLPDMIKIDGMLIAELESAPGARALTTAIVVFAHEMGMTVVGEGVESASSIDLLEALGVAYGQGFQLGSPEALR